MEKRKLIKKIDVDPMTEFDRGVPEATDLEREELEREAVANENKPVTEHLRRLAGMLNNENDDALQKLIKRRMDRAKRMYVKDYESLPD